MAYPPAALSTNATDGASPTDTTPTAVLTAAEVNATNAAVNDVVAELGANPSGAAASVAARLDGVDSAIAGLSGTYVQMWKASKAYAVGDIAINPSGVTVQCAVEHTSGGSYSGTNWTVTYDTSIATTAFVSAAVAATNAALGIFLAANYV